MTAESPLLLLHAEAGAPLDWARLTQPERLRPVTLTVGTLGKPIETIPSLPSLTSPQINLAHFRGYGLTALTALPELPHSLTSLDLQNLPKLTELPDLPPNLVRLTLAGLDSLRDLGAVPRLEKLRVLALKNLPILPTNLINRLLQAAPHLRQLHLQGCGALDTIVAWPEALEAIWLEDAPVMELPKTWPQPLHTLSLKDCARLTSEALPKPEALPATVMMVNLAGCRALTRLPFPEYRPAFPHTLHLAGSGLLRPLKSQHGADADTNVAAETRRYFSALQLLDTRRVARCKVLILGNGRAGKTYLTRALLGKKVTPEQNALPEDVKPAELRTTHSIQFHPWPGLKPKAKALEGDGAPVSHIHIWDFGGQELYHNTHQLFVRSGCLFVLVWNPEQDGQPAPADLHTQIQDVWRPLSYWFHLIRTSSDFGDTAKILLVHSHRPGHGTYLRSDLEKRWKAEAGDLEDRVQFFSVNSLADGQSELDLPALTGSLATETGRVIDAQGTAVPAHWDIALNLVEGWVSDPQYQQMSVTRFRDELSNAIRQALRKQGRTYPKLAKAWNKNFRLEDDAVRDTLRFLTQSGWAFWHEDRMPDTVIIGQKWAMDGIYAFTNREGALSAYLTESGGLIRASQVGALNWGSPHSEKPYTPEEHKILFGYAESCGVIFPLQNREERHQWGETVYAVPDRLPKTGEPDWALPAGAPPVSGAELPLTRAPWNRFLVECGKTFGTAGRYAQNAFRGETEDGQVIHATFDLRDNGIHADVTVQATAEELARQVLAQITEGAGTSGETLHAFKAKSARPIFLSYSWNQPRPGFDPENTLTLDVLGPVDAITAHLDPIPGLHLIRDNRAMQPGDHIPDFITEGLATADHILCIFSERYFHRPWCLLELSEILKRVDEDPNQFFQQVTPVLLHGVGFTEEDTNRRKDFWNTEKNIKAAKIPKAWNLKDWRDARSRFDHTLDVIGRWMGGGTLRHAVTWNPADKDGSLAAIRKRVER